MRGSERDRSIGNSVGQLSLVERCTGNAEYIRQLKLPRVRGGSGYKEGVESRR
ncbi:hypothetical protein AB0758_33065 [Tolypothrix bouteillei VB521301_2]|uniref:Uncharacterized protein n=1 Tax=Tolypothrix bouteillei VB521301 TaxID=1479485 RepID=A0A8S9SVV3_9CYAN|nr:hypothetical protein [Tolypothrix bouteillei]KAF3884076.1 hypothetical protein DA73_0400000085 [Tolypothrix bouteillei VB521301]